MSRDWESEFSDLQEFYPGSNKPIIRHTDKAASTVARDENTWDAKPKTYHVSGEPVEFFTVGQLAMALLRKPVTIRKWEREGIIPKAQYMAPSDDPRGKRRLYTRDQVEGMVAIAAEEGVLNPFQTPITTSRFTERVIKLFESLGVPGQ